MHSAVMTLFGVAAQPGHVLAAPGSLSPLASLARAQVSTSAAAPGADNQTWSEFTANAPRFAGAAQRLLVEGQRGNAIRNPRCEGTGGASGLPTNWSIGTSLTGLTVTNLGVFVVDGVHCVRVRVNGTPSASFMALAFDTTTGIVAAPSQAWAIVQARSTAESMVLPCIEPDRSMTTDTAVSMPSASQRRLKTCSLPASMRGARLPSKRPPIAPLSQPQRSGALRTRYS